MKLSDQFSYDLIIEYTKNNSININDIPDCDLDKLCSYIIEEDINFGNEILGFDNYIYKSKILPYLLAYLKNPTNNEYSENFLEEMREGIRDYLHHNILKKLEDALEEFNYQLSIDAA